MSRSFRVRSPSMTKTEGALAAAAEAPETSSERITSPMPVGTASVLAFLGAGALGTEGLACWMNVAAMLF